MATYNGSGSQPRDTWSASTAETASSDGSSVRTNNGPLLPASVLQSQNQWRQEPVTAPIQLPFDWTFKSLWSATEQANRKRKAPELNIPSTILFHSGDPTHWLSTDPASGRLVRVGFPKPPKTSGGGKHASRELRLRAAWDGLLRFSEQMRSEGVRPSSRAAKSKHKKKQSNQKETKETETDPNKEPVVVAWYRDGGREHLDLETWSRLMGHRTWRIQLAAIQGYVHPTNTLTGNYVALQQIDPRTRALPMKNPAMDAMSKKLAQYCESAHTHQLSDRTFAPSIRVIKLRAEFTIDLNGKLWHTHCSNVVGQEMAAPTPDPVQQAAMSVQLAAEAEGKLRKLLRMAANRGVDLETSFQHFDPDGRGAAHPGQFVSGIRKLGIALPPAAAELLLARIGRNDEGLITVEDFGAFVYEAFALAFPERSGTANSSLYMEGSPIDAVRMGTAGSMTSTLGSVAEDHEDHQEEEDARNNENQVGGSMTLESAGSGIVGSMNGSMGGSVSETSALNVGSLQSLGQSSSLEQIRSMKNVEQNKNALNSSNNPLLSTLNENVYNVDGGGSTMSGLNLDVNANSAVLNAAYDPHHPTRHNQLNQQHTLGHSSTFSDDMLPSWARPAAQDALIELQKRQIEYEKNPNQTILLPNGETNASIDLNKSSLLEDNENTKGTKGEGEEDGTSTVMSENESELELEPERKYSKRKRACIA